MSLKCNASTRNNIHANLGLAVIIVLAHVFIVKGGIETPLTHHYVSDVASYGVSNDVNQSRSSLDRIFYLIKEQRWQAETVLPVSLLPAAEVMSARSQHRIRQSATGLDDAGMDLQVAQLGARSGQEVSSTAALSWIDWEVPFPVVLCAVAGAVLFAFLFLLWLRRQMSSEKKKSGDGDRRGLVEEGAIGPAPQEKPGKSFKEQSPMEAKWVKPTSSIMPRVEPQPIAGVSEATGLPEVLSVITPERKPEPIRIKAKRLLERRGSNASLTIELAPVPDSPPHMVTPTRECTAEEFLLSAGNVLSRSQLKKAIQDPPSLHKEFWEVPRNVPDKVEIFGAGVKNRYSEVLPNEQSRVVLAGIEDPVGSYINANYIRGYDGEQCRYIATQGPLKHTIDDFWRMIWMDKATVIVMITKLYEASKTKCDVYFPLEVNSRIQAGPFTIILSSIDMRDGYTIRDFEIRHEGERRTIMHYWYDSWPDHEVPQSSDALVGLAAQVNSMSGPIVVHCSAGVGRTGCFIALATGMTQLLRDGNVDVLGILCQMRYDRGGMIQTAEQYEFVHRALCLFEQTLLGKGPSKSGD